MDGSSNLCNNPFVALFENVEQAEVFAIGAGASGSGLTTQQNTECHPVKEITNTENQLKQSYMIERIFLITLDTDKTPVEERPRQCVFLDNLVTLLDGQDWIDLYTLDQAVFERLTLRDPWSHVINTKAKGQYLQPEVEGQIGEMRALHYLYNCFVRLSSDKMALPDAKEKVLEIIINYSKLCLKTPEVLDVENTEKQVLDLLIGLGQDCNDNPDCLLKYFNMVAVEIGDANSDDVLTMRATFLNVLALVKQQMNNFLQLDDPRSLVYMNVIVFFSKIDYLAKVLMDFSWPVDGVNGKVWQDTLIGSTLTISCVPPHPRRGPFPFFTNPSQKTKRDHDSTEQRLWLSINTLNEKVYEIFLNMLKLSPEVKHKVLQWLADCLHANEGRGKMVSHFDPDLVHQLNAGDGFFINLSSVLLRLCKPFCAGRSTNILKVQVEYTMAQQFFTSAHQCTIYNLHMKDLHKETMLVRRSAENEVCASPITFNLVTEIFFLTEKCLSIGLNAANENFLQLNQQLHRIEQVYNDVINSPADGARRSSEMRLVKEEMDKGMTVFLSYKAALSETELVEMSLDFHAASAILLSQLATSDTCRPSDSNTMSLSLTQLNEVRLPLTQDIPKPLSFIPEFVLNNMIDSIIFCHRFKESAIEALGEHLDHLMTVFLIFMSSSRYLNNPHLRAKLAEALEAVMPLKAKSLNSPLVSSRYNMHRVFSKHRLSVHISQCVLNVFVAIEMTGQSVEFEQKFNYRRPMYRILEYIWQFELHRNALKRLSTEAEGTIESSDPPLFLKFINLLINDAIFVLDEALQHMTQIKDKQNEKDSGIWNDLTDEQRRENENNLKQLGMIVRFFNITSHDTVNTLEMLTREIKTIFTHDVMVDRIAAMLNFFLLHLVGSKRKELAVKNKDEYEFKPHELVSTICQLYVNLGQNDNFCLAVTRDGRSYSDSLFPLAEKILQRIHRPPNKIAEFTLLERKIKAVAKEQKIEEKITNEAPEEFLDTIMGTLMKDPVILPSSRQVVDRSTIARHLLSDQNDPYDRSPLTMDMLIPHTELREKIQQWLTENKAC